MWVFVFVCERMREREEAEEKKIRTLTAQVCERQREFVSVCLCDRASYCFLLSLNLFLLCFPWFTLKMKDLW